MFSLQLLDVAIGLVFVYLAMSLLCSGLNEWLAYALGSRANHLEDWLRTVLQGNNKDQQALVTAFTTHPLIKALAPPNKFPSYILPRTFLLAFLDTVAPINQVKGNRNLDDIRSSILQLSDPDLKKLLLTLLDSADNDFGLVRQNIEDWFNDAMERLSGTYKRRTRLVILGLAAVTTIALNANTVRVFDTLYRDSAVRAAVAAAAQQAAQAPNPSDQSSPLTRVNQVQSELQALNLPIGWTDPTLVPPYDDHKGWAIIVCGWLITTLAVSQGAPFWFDILNKLVNVRTTGARPATAASTASSTDLHIVVQPTASPAVGATVNGLPPQPQPAQQ